MGTIGSSHVVGSDEFNKQIGKRSSEYGTLDMPQTHNFDNSTLASSSFLKIIDTT